MHQATLFQSTLLVRGATSDRATEIQKRVISIHAPRERSDLGSLSNIGTLSISIHAPRERSDATVFQLIPRSLVISIHAPRERSDYAACKFTFSILRISIHAPRERSDHRSPLLNPHRHLFQSTLLVRGATDKLTPVFRDMVISIHAPRERSDCRNC